MIKRNVLGKPIANYGKKETAQLREMFGYLFFLAACAYLYFFEFVPHSFSGETYELERTVTMYAALAVMVAIVRMVYLRNLDMPYLSFTEDRFYFDNDGSETGGFWQEVESITSVEIQDEASPRQSMILGKFAPFLVMKKIAQSRMPGPPVFGWEILYRDGKSFLIDPREIETQGDDILEVATYFWENSNQSAK